MDDVKTAFVCVRCMDVKLRARSPETSYSGPALLCAICRHFGHGAVIPVTRCEWGHLTPLAHADDVPAAPNRNTDPKPTTYAEWEDLEEERDSLRADRDRLASELQAVCTELARTKRNHLRRMAGACREMWHNVTERKKTERIARRYIRLRDAINAALAALEGGAK